MLDKQLDNSRVISENVDRPRLDLGLHSGMEVLNSLIVSPHTQDANYFFFGKDFVHDAVLNIDAARICAGKITDQLLEGWWILKWVAGKNREQFLSLRFKATCSKLLCVLHCLLGINNLPTHHLSAFELFARGSAIPALMDSRMPGTANRYKVS